MVFRAPCSQHLIGSKVSSLANLAKGSDVRAPKNKRWAALHYRGSIREQEVLPCTAEPLHCCSTRHKSEAAIMPLLEIVYFHPCSCHHSSAPTPSKHNDNVFPVTAGKCSSYWLWNQKCVASRATANDLGRVGRGKSRQGETNQAGARD